MPPDKRVLIDTSVMIDFLRGVDKSKDWIDSINPENRLISFLTIAEIAAGCRNKNELKKVERELKGYALVYLDSKCCKQSIEWYKDFHLSHGVGFLDCLIAATAYKKNVPIATLDDKHFKQITGISVFRPY
ncbi:MAG: type II toxin-antitoxin system VapC family toxin [Candidatus Kuenenia sp.]|nr:type II toxin-antitoxin system VapC family toxin [Candidatus Kuenenia hertensis]